MRGLLSCIIGVGSFLWDLHKNIELRKKQSTVDGALYEIQDPMGNIHKVYIDDYKQAVLFHFWERGERVFFPNKANSYVIKGINWSYAARAMVGNKIVPDEKKVDDVCSKMVNHSDPALYALDKEYIKRRIRDACYGVAFLESVKSQIPALYEQEIQAFRDIHRKKVFLVQEIYVHKSNHNAARIAKAWYEKAVQQKNITRLEDHYSDAQIANTVIALQRDELPKDALEVFENGDRVCLVELDDKFVVYLLHFVMEYQFDEESIVNELSVMHSTLLVSEFLSRCRFRLSDEAREIFGILSVHD